MNNIILSRASVRKFKETIVSKEIIKELLRAGMAAPCACNEQAWEYFVVENKETILKLRKASRYSNYDSPLVICLCANKNRALDSKIGDFWIQDLAASAENILLCATSLGLGGVWIGIHPVEAFKKRVVEALNLQDEYIPFCLLFIGYPDGDVKPRDKFKEEYIHYIK